MVRRLTKLARCLRKRQTPTEAKMWACLRNRKLLNIKFRRQYPIGPYIVDFCAIQHKLVIEVDGGGHLSDEQKVNDRIRDYYLEKRGYIVMRFWANDVNNNLEGVVQMIYEFISSNSS